MGKYDEAAKRAMERTERELAGMIDRIADADPARLAAVMPDQDSRAEVLRLCHDLKGTTDRNVQLLGLKACMEKLGVGALRALKTALGTLLLALAAAAPAWADPALDLGAAPLGSGSIAVAQPADSGGITLPFKAVDVVALAQIPERRVAFGVAAPLADLYKILEWNAGAMNKEEGPRVFTGAMFNVRELLEWMGSTAFHYRLTQDLSLGYAVVVTVPDLKWTHGPQVAWRFGGNQ